MGNNVVTVGADPCVRSFGLCICPSMWITNQYSMVFKVEGQTHGSAPTVIMI